MFTYAGPCGSDGITLRRSLTDLSGGNEDQLFAHKLPCTLANTRAYTVRLDATRGDGRRYRGELDFSTNNSRSEPPLTVLEQVAVPKHVVDNALDHYITETLLREIDSRFLALLAAVAVGKIADLSWRQLTKRAAYGVISQRVSYASRRPNGEHAILTGLVAMPDTRTIVDFEPRSRVVVLSHSTGSTPSSLSITDGWYMLANVIAGRGYLVIAPDNWGRGGSSGDGDGTDRPEPYLMANRVANNTLDMVRAVLDDDDYRAFHDPDNDTDVAVVGYSQGGHSAVAVWLAAQVADAIEVRELYSGGAPHDLYATFRGALQRLDGSCDANPWCRDVHVRTISPYITNRILPPLLAYTDVGLTRDELVDGDRVAQEFVTGMLNNDSRYDALKTVLQLNSFTNLVDPAEALTDHDTRIHLYHSPFDRLVPERNTRDFADLLLPEFNVEYHDDECDSDLYSVLSDTVPIVGFIHSVCGMETLDEVLKDFRDREAAEAGTDSGEPDVPSTRRSLSGWRTLAEMRAKEVANDPEALDGLRRSASAESLGVLAELLRDTGSADLDHLADELERR